MKELKLYKQLESVIKQVDEGLRKLQPHHIMNLTEAQANFLKRRYEEKYCVEVDKEKGAYSVHVVWQAPVLSRRQTSDGLWSCGEMNSLGPGSPRPFSNSCERTYINIGGMKATR